MKIAELSVKNVRAVPDLTRSLRDRSKKPFDVVLVTGPTGSGKTRLLEAIALWKEAVGAYGIAPKLSDKERRPGEGGSLSGVWELTPEEVRRGQLDSGAVEAKVDVGTRAGGGDAAGGGGAPRGLSRVLSAFFREETHGKVEYFPAGRRLSKAPLPVPLEALSEQVECGMRLGKEEGKYGIERAWVRERLLSDLSAAGSTLSDRGVLLSGQAPDSLAGARAKVARLAPHLRLSGLIGSGPKARVGFLRQGLSSGERSEVDIDDLSAGEEQAVLFALAFERLRLSRSVVLIDTPELAVHPADQARFFQALCNLGTDNQVIAATCSPGILASVPPEQIIDLGSPERRA